MIKRISLIIIIKKIISLYFVGPFLIWENQQCFDSDSMKIFCLRIQFFRIRKKNSLTYEMTEKK